MSNTEEIRCIQERLVKCFMLAMPNMTQVDTTQASRDTVAEWDSLATAGLLSLIEEEFNVIIPAEDINEFVSFARVLQVVIDCIAKDHRRFIK
jgi:acyl carrier protein